MSVRLSRLLTFVAAVTLAATGCSGSGDSPNTAKSEAGGRCRPVVRNDALPSWARKDFPQGGAQRHMVGEKGEIAAVLFGFPYHAPAAKGRENKILWVPKDSEGAADMGPDDKLTIKASLAGTNEVVTRSIAGGPGPSLVDMPKPGCWKFSLSWPGHSDSLDVEYLAG
ncbi:hypothetical protein [Streptomyces acidiscabies]|uniref:hypothetical protein n=1 Tax=Streptomyces acidiscabies TaxID=42234 RepID=UPI0009607844|nr:hypothetical protein [Streptomyces acidiscabies]GAV42540.1 hypothetical protein Saa2_05471 [Streptomyces acidiscabies]